MVQPAVPLKETFQQNSCPANLPIYDSGITPAGVSVPLAAVIGAAAPHADILSVGDSDHFNPAVRGSLGTDAVLDQLKRSGITHIGVEVSHRMQHWIDKLNDGALTREEFERKIDLSLSVTQGNEKGDWTRQLGRTAAFARDNGMKLQFIDPDNGSHFCDETTLSASEYEACDVRKWKQRFQDDALAGELNASVPAGSGNKALLLYGQAHLSVDNGTRQQIDGRVIKIDVFESRAAYEADKMGLHKRNAEAGINTNQIKPDLIYFLDTQTVHTTCATPPALAASIEAAAAIERAKAPRAPEREPDAEPGAEPATKKTQLNPAEAATP